MKVLLCSPLTGKVGGILLWAKHILNFYRSADSGIEIDVVDARRKSNIYPDTPFTLRVYKGVQEYSSVLKNVRHKLKAERFDVLHLVSSASFSLLKDYLILKWAKRCNTPTAIHFHFGRIPQIFSEKKWEFRLIKKVISAADSIIVIDLVSFQALKSEGYKNVYYLPNPLSPNVVEIIKDHGDIVRKPNKIMFAGNVIETKGIHELIQACTKIEDAEVYIIGDISDEMVELVHMGTQNHLNRFHVLGEKNHETIIKEMLSSRIFVLPSYTEGFPNVILESMAAGCSIVSTGVGAIPEMLAIGSEHPCGLVVEPRNTAQLQSAIEMLLTDRELSAQLARNAVQKVNEDYNIKNVTEKLTDIWSNTAKYE